MLGQCFVTSSDDCGYRCGDRGGCQVCRFLTRYFSIFEGVGFDLLNTFENMEIRLPFFSQTINLSLG